MSNKHDEPTVFHTETSYLALKFMCFMIGLACFIFAIESFFSLFTMPWNGLFDRIVGIIFTLVLSYISYRFLKPTFLLLKRLLIDPILNLFRFIKRLLIKLTR